LSLWLRIVYRGGDVRITALLGLLFGCEDIFVFIIKVVLKQLLELWFSEQ
jgi:hypothetical protein